MRTETAPLPRAGALSVRTDIAQNRRAHDLAAVTGPSTPTLHSGCAICAARVSVERSHPGRPQNPPCHVLGRNTALLEIGSLGAFAKRIRMVQERTESAPPNLLTWGLEVHGSRWASRSSKPLWGAVQRPGWVRLPRTSATEDDADVGSYRVPSSPAFDLWIPHGRAGCVVGGVTVNDHDDRSPQLASVGKDCRTWPTMPSRPSRRSDESRWRLWAGACRHPWACECGWSP